jgi:hypothetical protein
MAPEAAREDAGGLDRWSVCEVTQSDERPDGDAPTPTVAAWVVLRISHDLHDGEDRLPSGRVTDGHVAPLDPGSPRGRVASQGLLADERVKWTVARTADEEPVLPHRATIAATG